MRMAIRPQYSREVIGLSTGKCPIMAWSGRARALPAVREIRMSRYRRLKIEGGAFFCTLALADRDLPLPAGESAG
jgi:hypothetical protein